LLAVPSVPVAGVAAAQSRLDIAGVSHPYGACNSLPTPC